MKSSTWLLTVVAASVAIAGPLDKRFLPDVAQVETFSTTATVGSELSAASAAAIAPVGRRICRGRKSSSKPPTDSIPAATSSATPVSTDSATLALTDPAALAPVDPTTPVPADSTPLPADSTPLPTDSTPSPPTNSEIPGGGTSNGNPPNTDDDDSSNDGGDPFIGASLMHHNVHRANHSAADLEWNAEIAGYAATTAATCRFAHDTKTGGGGYGQNIAMWASSRDVAETGEVAFIGQTITEMWYNGELELFPANGYGQDQPDMSDFSLWGHFTQMVWKKTTSVGCHVQYCPPGTMSPNMGAFFSVCNYSPPGNMGGAYGENVGRPLGQPIFNAD